MHISDIQVKFTLSGSRDRSGLEQFVYFLKIIPNTQNTKQPITQITQMNNKQTDVQ